MCHEPCTSDGGLEARGGDTRRSMELVGIVMDHRKVNGRCIRMSAAALSKVSSARMGFRVHVMPLQRTED